MMSELIGNIYEHKKNDSKIVYNLMELIDQNGFKTVKELQKFEDDKYTPFGTEEKISDEDIAEQLFIAFVNDNTHYDYLDGEAETDLKLLYDAYVKETDIDKKRILIIKIYSVLDWGIPYPFYAYKYIMEDKL
jgi:hypothetical protein